VDNADCDCNHLETLPLPTAVGSIAAALNLEPEEPDSRKTRRYKSDDAITDQQSTGRKRAAVLYPLDKSKPCEWAELKEAGGGFKPIQGCGLRPGTFIGRQLARHHGPDQNTLNNDPGNVHRICTKCHNEWHAKNDPYKDQMYEKIYGHKPSKENLSNAAKALKSGVVSGGHIKDKGE
jgi:hypothetical protein